MRHDQVVIPCSRGVDFGDVIVQFRVNQLDADLDAISRLSLEHGKPFIQAVIHRSADQGDLELLAGHGLTPQSGPVAFRTFRHPALGSKR